MLWCVIMAGIGFLSGSIMYSYYIPRILYRLDVRGYSEDGNPGSTGAIRAVGVPLGLLCMLLDIAKGFLPVFAAIAIIGVRGYYLIPVIAAPTYGHAFSPLLGFKGGKAVATSYGTLLALLPLSRAVFCLALVMVFFRFILVIRPDSLMVAVTHILANILLLFIEPLLYVKIGVGLISLVVCYKLSVNPDRGRHTLSLWHYSLIREGERFRICSREKLKLQENSES